MTVSDWGIIFEVLANEQRRRVLVTLLEHNPQCGKVKVPEDVGVGGTELAKLRIKYYHLHLPKLDAAGFINWNRDSLEIVKGPSFSEIRPLLELIQNHRDELPDGWVKSCPSPSSN